MLNKIMSHHNGFNLVELMIVIAIISILASVSLPMYSSFVERARRAEAKKSLINIYIQQIEEFQDSYSYKKIIPPTLNFYTITMIPELPIDSFMVTATAISSQVNDKNCLTFSINEKGERTSDGASGPNASCWD